MKQRFNKLLATVLAATLCVPALPSVPVQAAESIIWMDPETISANQISEDERFINFNEDWKFYFGDSSTAQNVNFIDSSWEDVTLPHDFSITQDFTSEGEAESGFLPGGTGWYRKKFALPESFANKSVVLNFDGVYKDTTVYVNGNKIGEHHYGYTPFAFDISDYLTCDGATENVIAVKAEHRLPSSRWYSGSGIYRDVTLIVANPVHVDLNGTFVTTPKLASKNGTDGTASIAVEVKNSGESAANVTVKNTVFKKGSDTPAASANDVTASVAAGETKTVTASASVSNPDLWSIDEPNLYTVKTEIVQDGKTIDTYETEFGYKWYEFVDNTGFKLNGENVKINGVCMHHDQGALGSAAYYDAIYRQMATMKDMGVNTIRITHNPGAKHLINICNELGLLVIEEFFDGWAWPKNSNNNDFSAHFTQNMTDDNQVIGGDSSMTWAEFTLKSLVKRDRNDASIILWSLCNEVDEGSGGGPWDDLADNIIRWTKEADETHPVTSGSNRRSLSSPGDTSVLIVNQKVYEAGGVPGYNYGDINSMNALHERYPVMLWSETVSPSISRGIYTTQNSQANADGKYHLTSYDTSHVGWGQSSHYSMYYTMTTDYIAGECMWTGFDYIGEPTPWNGTGTGDGGRGAIPNSSYFGIVETSGFPKDSFYLYRSQWNQKENTLHLVTAWDPENQMITNGKTPVWVYSNAPKVELYLNGTKIGTATRKALNETTTAAGHVHYEYTTESNSDVCATSSGSNEESLYSVFNVAFTEGTISAKAYDENGTEITNSCEGTSSISTPKAAAKLAIAEDCPESIDADGKSLAYITVDVTDANDRFKTTANNKINFSLTGNGEIVGVDNGDQATVNKFQQKSVLTSSTSAWINAYAGKALVIVRSTKDGGSFTLTAESDGLASASATVTTKAVGEGSSSSSIQSYTMSRHCYLPVNTKKSDIRLPQTADAILYDGSSQKLTISWPNYNDSILAQKGNHRIDGSISYKGQSINVYVQLHVYKPIISVQNHALCTSPGTVPAALPTVSMAYDTDGDAFEEYPVNWDTKNLTSDMFAAVDDIVTINGTASIFGKSYPATASVRVVDPEVSYKNVATVRAHLADNAYENGSKEDGNGNKTYNDTLTAVTDGNRIDDGTSASRWSDWNHKNSNAAQTNLQIAMDWDTVTTTDKIDIYYFTNTNDNGALPTSVQIHYADSSNYNETTKMLETTNWIPVTITGTTDLGSTQVGDAGNLATVGKSYQLERLINPQAIRITFGHDGGSYIGVNEIEVLHPVYSYALNSGAALTSVKLGGKTIEFKEGQTEYTIDASSIEINDITFENEENASVTVLPISKRKVQIISVSEDGKQTKIYTLQSNDAPKKETTEAVQDAVKNFNELSSSAYASSSYNALKALVAEIEQNMNNYSESELKAKLNELNTKKSNLAKVATYNSLKQKLTDYGKLKETDYTPASWKKLNDLIKKIKSEIDSYSESKLQEQIKELDKARQALVTATNNTPKIETATVKNVQYKILDDKKKTATALKLDNAKATTITIQPTVKIGTDTYKVVEIAPNAFKASKLKSVTIGKNVKTIGKNAFNNCKKLNKVTFKGSSAPKLGSGAFKKTASKITVKVPKKLKKTAFKKQLIKAGMSKKLKLK